MRTVVTLMLFSFGGWAQFRTNVPLVVAPTTVTDSKHQGRAGYVYNSINCYQCHPRGSG